MQVGDTLIGGPICDHRLTVVFEDSDGGPRESGSQDQRGMVQFITQNQTALQDTRPTLKCINDSYTGRAFIHLTLHMQTYLKSV